MQVSNVDREPRLLQPHADGLDDGAEAFDIGRDQPPQRFCPDLVGLRNIGCELSEAAPQVRIGECGLERGFKTFEDGFRRGSGCFDRVPDRQVESGYAGLGKGRHIRNLGEALGGSRSQSR